MWLAYLIMVVVVLAIYTVYRQPRLWNLSMVLIFLIAHMFVPHMSVLPVVSSVVYVVLSILLTFSGRVEVAIITVVLLETLAVWRTNAVASGIMCLIVLMVHTAHLLAAFIARAAPMVLPKKG